MNRIILIGNGFDLAHKMPTSYKHFLDDLWGLVFNNILKLNPLDKYNDENIIINSLPIDWPNGYSSLNFVNKLGDRIYFKNIFLKIITNKSLENWVDIENEYYTLLLYSIKNTNIYNKVSKLNTDFKKIEHYLTLYLSKVEKDFCKEFDMELINKIRAKIYSEFKLRDFTEKSIVLKVKEEFKKISTDIKGISDNQISYDDLNNETRSLLSKLDLKNTFKSLKELLLSKNAKEHFSFIPNHTLFLNFNYTSTESVYTNPNMIKTNKTVFAKKTIPEVIHIHGRLNTKTNPIIFGYGDEIDNDYLTIEKLNNNKYLENIKSIKYLETANYKHLLNFINSQYYQILILGHSCGVSDRTLLNTLFEHENCVSIKPYFHQKEKGDNYSDLVRNISRCFINKKTMREKVVNRTYCESLS